ncbi:phosphatidate cytidylyltransferase [Paenibacillus baekrokdamisoli]|uniref:Phosphatidate cytidylyltransferase n=1 Tax=Paenibacillus baekrokdamisoli TaxID=1712516 RepID=A0A3G9JAA4_9BACL|nr:phosphatidate cytidylyltransferase [Paenibacillus baekrokdamisoli]MBB3069808.1 phosphatidate cytidylyltransferase [Paenibacillus baekrokdamisoli]BBH20838.1 phosphatidate cytidylyltransferase [Paenibacillus baekrokdamisoli]
MKQRIITGLIGGAIFVLLTVAGGWYFYGLLLLLALVGFWEYIRMNSLSWRHPASLVGFAGVLILLFPWHELDIQQPNGLHMLWLLLFLLLIVTVLTKNKFTIDGAALLLLGALYVGYGFHAMFEVRNAGSHGLLATFLAFGSIWASDIGAYFFGRAIGKHKLWPSISPNKTIEGSLGGVILSIIVALVFAWIYPDLIPFGRAILIGLTAAVAGQLGDLIQSAYKRVRGIKDTGSILPGHGGVLDRCDSWLIVFPLLIMMELLPLG